MSNQQIKLFLSVDIAGSTNLKNTNNYYQIQNFCQEFIDTSKKINDSSTLHLCTVYKNICDKYEHQDWSQIIKQCFRDFNLDFINNRSAFNKSPELFPWKMAGDELIYCLDVESRRDVYNEVLAFYKTLRFFDKGFEKKDNSIRLKGSAWTAGFPVRNRIMAPLDEASSNKENANSDSIQKIDFMGPEIDIGFRIGKFTSPGIICVSLELACILLDDNMGFSDKDNEMFKVVDTGWEYLKGVWNGKKYPIYWLCLPDKYKDEETIKYEPYHQWNLEEDEHLKKYAKAINKPYSFVTWESIKSLIKELPKEFDLVIPYFVKDGDVTPPEHVARLDFIQLVDEYQLQKNNQEGLDNEQKVDSISTKESISRIENIKINPST